MYFFKTTKLQERNHILYFFKTTKLQEKNHILYFYKTSKSRESCEFSSFKVISPSFSTGHQCQETTHTHHHTEVAVAALQEGVCHQTHTCAEEGRHQGKGCQCVAWICNCHSLKWMKQGYIFFKKC